MSIFGKLTNTAKQKVNVKGLVKGVSAQQIIGGNDAIGGKSKLFGGLFGGGKKAVAKQQALELATQYQSAMKSGIKPPDINGATEPTPVAKYVFWAALGVAALWLLKKIFKF